EAFGAGMRGPLGNGASGFGIYPGGAVFDVIAGDTGNRHVPQTQFLNRFGDPVWLIGIVFFRFSGGNITKRTASGAYGPTDEEGCFAVFPTFINIGAIGLGTYGIQ